MFANLSILGLWNYNNEIFDLMVIPQAVNRDTLITNILTECSDFSLLYPDYDFMKTLIGRWSTIEAGVWDAMLRSTQLEYNPIENYDRYEDVQRQTTEARDSARNKTGDSLKNGNARSSAQSNADSQGLSSANKSSTNTENGTITSGQTAFNSNTIKDTTQQQTDGSNSTTDTENTVNQGREESAGSSESTTIQQDSAREDETTQDRQQGTEIVSTRVHGNIGVTTAQQMIAGFREISEFNIYDYITNSFKNRFCVQVY